MKKVVKYCLLFFLSFICMNSVKAESINSIEMDINIDLFGNANVTEVWKAHPTEKTEYYHAFYNIGNSKITNLKVHDENKNYTEIEWDVDASKEEKAYHYGYNYTDKGVELCFGKSSYGSHTYTMEYKITNFVSKTSDGYQIIYWNLLDSINPAPSNVKIRIHSIKKFDEDMELRAYGQKGVPIKIVNGEIIYETNKKFDKYAVILAKIEDDMFLTYNELENDFDYYLDRAEKGADHYNNDMPLWAAIITSLFGFAIPFLTIIGVYKFANTGIGSYKLDFGKTGKKVKNKDMFRDIPCNKDIFRGFFVAFNYGLMKKYTDFLGVILLKWTKQGNIKLESDESGVFKNDKSKVIFVSADSLDNEVESKLYKYMFEASKDGVLESKEFERWCKKNYTKVNKWFKEAMDYVCDRLIEEGKITKTKKRDFGIKHTVYIVDSSMMEEAIQMKGLKNFFNEFDNMTDKEAVHVMLWQEYLMFAQMFGVAKKVAKQFKKLYPDVITDYDYNSMLFIYSFSDSGMSSIASAAGGGYSSGGGGGGSFGGGGGGSR